MRLSLTPISGRAPATTRNLLSVVAAVFLLALGARVAFLAVRGVQISPDSADYVRLAENVRAHGAFSLDADAPFTPTIRRAPLYSIFLIAFSMREGVSTRGAVVGQILLDSVVAVLVLLLAYAALSLRWAAGASLAYAVHPGSIYLTTAILSESLFTALLVTGVLLLLYGLVKNHFALTALGGVAFGLATLCRPVALPLPFLLIGVSLLAAPRIPRRWLHAALLVACAAIIVAPWAIRCSRAAGQLVLVQGLTPSLFYAATRYDWNQQDQETLWPRFANEDPYGRRLHAARSPEEVAEADRFGFRLGLQNIRSDPRAYLASRARSFPYLFITSFDTFTGVNKSFGHLLSQGDIPRLVLKLILLLLFSLIPFLLGVVGLFDNRRSLAALFPATVWVYTLLANLPMWVEYRYWIPVVPFLLVSAAHGSQLLARKIKYPSRYVAD